MIKKFMVKATAVAVMGAALSMAAQAAEVTLKYHSFLPGKAPAHSKLIKEWTESIAEASNGRIEVKMYTAMQLGGKPPQLVDQVQDGFADIIWTLPGYTPGRYPAISAFELPFMVTDRCRLSSQICIHYFSGYMIVVSFIRKAMQSIQLLSLKARSCVIQAAL
jgi:TRAP-type C4-dicarboxylate transport system substrate-binding protein